MLRVATLNAGSLFEPDWTDRRHEVVAWLDHLDADIVCLQEIWESPTEANTAAWLVDRAARDWHWVFGGCRLDGAGRPDAVTFGSAILSRWPIDHHELIPLPVDAAPARQKAGFTMALELVHARTAGIDVFSTHLAPPPEQAYHRITQVQFIDEAIRSRQDVTSLLPPILCGDFNAEPDSDEIRFLSSLATIDGTSTYYQDAWRATGTTEPGFTWDSLDNPLAADMHLPPKRIDYVFVGDPYGRPEGAGLVIGADLAFHEPITGCVASDHYGLVVDIRWPQRGHTERATRP
ncbi:MAG: endonuclease/exonuclease/phosphatase family protein [Acidimicrobiia bacterium]|nr:endonuclease/exonuclease/phosphatase family protein [Acidimicrobiia bacterium]